MSTGSKDGVTFEVGYRRTLTAYGDDEAEEARLMSALGPERAALAEEDGKPTDDGPVVIARYWGLPP